MDELPGGFRRITIPLRSPPGHVQCYLLPGPDGWTLIDAGLGTPEAIEHWQRELAQLDAPVARIVITHFHPDHVGGAADLAELTGAPVFEGRIDVGQSHLAWGDGSSEERLERWFARHGLPADIAAEVVATAPTIRPFVHPPTDPALLDDGDVIDGWDVVVSPGHADGQLTLLKDGVLIAADHVLGRITPMIGLWPGHRADPLGAYLEALEHTIALAPRYALPGHGAPIESPVERARELIAHHHERLDITRAALSSEPQTGYQLSLPLFRSDLAPLQRRMAVGETLSHVERLVHAGRAERHEDVGAVFYTAAQ